MASTIRSTTQQQMDVEDVIDNLILQKDGSCTMVLQMNAVNFGLLSEEEQDATIYAYAAFLNSLTFSIQILIRSDVKDISGYLKLLEEQEIKQPNQIKKKQIHSYRNFISSLITERNVLEKKFYIALNFSTLELGVSQSFSASFFKSKTTLPFEKSYIIEKAKANLDPKRDHVVRQLARIGLGARQLNTQELIQLLFSMYNASSTQGQKITNTNDYTVPLVQPAYTRPQEVKMDDVNMNAAPTQNTQTPAAPAGESPTIQKPQPETPAQPTPQTPPVTPPIQTPPTEGQPQNPQPTPPAAPAPIQRPPTPPTSPTPQQPTAPSPAGQTPVMPTPPVSPTQQPTQQTPPVTPPVQTPPTEGQPQPQNPDSSFDEAQNAINAAAQNLTGE